MSTHMHAKNLTEQYQDVLDAYLHAHGDAPARMEDVARWALREGRIKPVQSDLIRRTARALSQAARVDYHEDPQGRRVRRKHAVRIVDEATGQQQVLWADIESASPEHMRVALQQRRQSIFHDVRQHKTDVDSYNDNNHHGAQLTFDYNYNLDLEESELPTEYPDERPDDEESQDAL